ncbi:MAG: anaerobic ribonucleoside-triphosphate reductase [Helicobacteraceae bacterium]|jgi:hypothetical protein|nr:anaerobic ribonucleoside-triphosphate reductase [Helicobacteraceae bacterium]
MKDKHEAIAAKIKANGKEKERVKCQVYTRVMGYHRPIESFNLGKQGEHDERVKFEERERGESGGDVVMEKKQ